MPTIETPKRRDFTCPSELVQMWTVYQRLANHLAGISVKIRCNEVQNETPLATDKGATEYKTEIYL